MDRDDERVSNDESEEEIVDIELEINKWKLEARRSYVLETINSQIKLDRE